MIGKIEKVMLGMMILLLCGLLIVMPLVMMVMVYTNYGISGLLSLTIIISGALCISYLIGDRIIGNKK